MSKKQRIEIKQTEDMQLIDNELDAALKALEDANTKVTDVLEIEKNTQTAPLFTGIPDSAPNAMPEADAPAEHEAGNNRN
jgi:hypothetical protein